MDHTNKATTGVCVVNEGDSSPTHFSKDTSMGKIRYSTDSGEPAKEVVEEFRDWKLQD